MNKYQRVRKRWAEIKEKIPKYKTTKTLKEIKATTISNEEVMKGFTSKERKEIRAKEKKYKFKSEYQKALYKLLSL